MRRVFSSAVALNGGGYTVLKFDEQSEIDLTIRAKSVVLGPLRPAGKNRNRYLSYLAGRAALAELFQVFGLSVKVRANPVWGFLQVVDAEGYGCSNVFVNVSHTGGVAAAVVSAAPVGIDIESASRSAEKVKSRMASNHELNSLPNEILVCGKKIPALITLWSAKEAISKATGLGLKFGLQNFLVDFNQDSPFPVLVQQAGPLRLEKPALVASVCHEYVVTICSERCQLLSPIKEIKYGELALK